MFFLKIGIVDFGLDFGAIDTEVHKKSVSTEGTKGTDNLPPLLPIFLNAIFIKIDPRGEEFAMLLPRPQVIGNLVAWGYHLCVPV